MTIIANALFILSIFSGIMCLLWWTFYEFDNPLAPENVVTDFFQSPLVTRALSVSSIYVLAVLIPFAIVSFFSNTTAEELVATSISMAFVFATLEIRDDFELV